MKVAILGSRGIPNRYGGFEELAEKLAMGLADRGHEVVVYNPHDHPIRNWSYPKVTLVRVLNPETLLGSFGQFIYDLGATIHARSSRPDIVLQLGYTSSSVWFWLLHSSSKVLTNMDGLEWKRSKYSKLVRRFLRHAERWAAKQSHLLVADNPQIEVYLHECFSNQVIYIPYGADIPKDFDESIPSQYGLNPGQYHLIIARMEPENHIAQILQGFHESNTTQKLVVIGGLNRFGQKMKAKYNHDQRIVFLGALYQKDELNSLRHFSRLYFHGHSVGGTNPSLLEAMACSCQIIAHNNAFNRSVLGENAFYFSTVKDVQLAIEKSHKQQDWDKMVRKNSSAIRDNYNWRIVVEQYEVAMQQLRIG